MPYRDRPAPTGRATTGRRYLTIGAVTVAVLVGAYVLMGTPGLHTQIANAPTVTASASTE